jgi:hypothetical protein
MTEAAARRAEASPGGSGNNIVCVAGPVLGFLRSPENNGIIAKRTDYGGGSRSAKNVPKYQNAVQF